MNPLLLTDGYKLDHRRQYPEGTTLVYSNWTPRKSRIPNVEKVVFFGLQYFIKEYLIHQFEQYFFAQPKNQVLKEYARIINNYLGPNEVGTDHIAALHDLGYLPIVIKALPEGSLVPFKVPMFTIYNTLPEFFWLTNYFETIMSTSIWLPCTSATIAHQYKILLTKYAALSSDDLQAVDYQAHDFSMRGLAGMDAVMTSGAAHLLSFKGTDSVPSLTFIEKYYNGNTDHSLIGTTVPATEHSVMCMGTQGDELGTFKRLITEIYPSGIVSVVSDTWNLWTVLLEYLPLLKEDITNRQGKLVIRPDSGDPVHILCGNPNGATDAEKKGVIALLWDVFGGKTNSKGYKELAPCIGAIYGDSITLERAEAICQQLLAKGFASTNVVLGVGSFTYQYNTRDTFGFAMKATYGEVKGVGRAIFKNPITDDGTKKSAKGLLKVVRQDGTYVLEDNVTWAEEQTGALQTVYKDGQLLLNENFSTIQSRLA